MNIQTPDSFHHNIKGLYFFVAPGLLPTSTLRCDLIGTATQTEIKRPRVVTVMDVPVARYRRGRWMEGR